MIKTGIVSVTFRNSTPEEVISLASKAGLDGIEWSSNAHVPYGDLSGARRVLNLTEDAGLQVASYGSYYRVGTEREKVLFEKVLETSIELKAPVIRVWAGDKSSESADDAWWDCVVEDSLRIVEMAQKQGIGIAYEYHLKTLTDTVESSIKLLNEVGNRGVRSYWQPPYQVEYNSRLNSLKKILPWLANIHVHHLKSWERQPLKEGIKEWYSYFEYAVRAEGDRYAMLEFVCGNTEEQFFEDAKVLKQLLESVQAEY